MDEPSSASRSLRKNAQSAAGKASTPSVQRSVGLPRCARVGTGAALACARQSAARAAVVCPRCVARPARRPALLHARAHLRLPRARSGRAHRARARPTRRPRTLAARASLRARGLLVSRCEHRGAGTRPLRVGGKLASLGVVAVPAARSPTRLHGRAHGRFVSRAALHRASTAGPSFVRCPFFSRARRLARAAWCSAPRTCSVASRCSSSRCSCAFSAQRTSVRPALARAIVVVVCLTWTTCSGTPTPRSAKGATVGCDQKPAGAGPRRARGCGDRRRSCPATPRCTALLPSRQRRARRLLVRRTSSSRATQTQPSRACRRTRATPRKATLATGQRTTTTWCARPSTSARSSSAARSSVRLVQISGSWWLYRRMAPFPTPR